MNKLLFLLLTIVPLLLSSSLSYADNQTTVKIGNQWFPVHTPTADELKDLKTTTDSIHDWLQRPDGTLCMNPASPNTVIMQKSWQYAKDHGIQLSYLDNPWPSLCSTNESQANDYYSQLNKGEIP